MLKFASLSLAATLVFVGGVVASEPPKVKPGVYDPDRTRAVSAKWVAREGLPDDDDDCYRPRRADFALVLAKTTATATNASAGAVVRGMDGRRAFTTYGFDIRTDSYAGAGAPRFNLLTEQGTFHFIGGAANGEVVRRITDRRGRTWDRVVFDPTLDAFPPIPPGSTIDYLEIVVDEDTRGAPSRSSILDNIRVGRTVIGGPDDDDV